jgi:uncharacterized protein (DUF1778 family)
MAKQMIGIKVTPDQKTKLQELANAENRPLANFCLTLIIEKVREKFNVDLSKDNNKK